MERVKDISKIKLYKGNVLLKLIEKKQSQIILSTEVEAKDNPNISHGIIVGLADDVTDLAVGDIVLDFGPSSLMEWQGSKYCITIRMAILFALTPDNFDEKKTIKQLAT